MNFSISSLAASFIFSVFGFYVIKRGKTHGDLRWIGIGLALVVYSYFFSNPFLVWGIGAALLGYAYLTR